MKRIGWETEPETEAAEVLREHRARQRFRETERRAALEAMTPEQFRGWSDGDLKAELARAEAESARLEELADAAYAAYEEHYSAWERFKEEDVAALEDEIERRREVWGYPELKARGLASVPQTSWIATRENDVVTLRVGCQHEKTREVGEWAEGVPMLKCEACDGLLHWAHADWPKPTFVTIGRCLPLTPMEPEVAPPEEMRIDSGPR